MSLKKTALVQLLISASLVMPALASFAGNAVYDNVSPEIKAMLCKNLSVDSISKQEPGISMKDSFEACGKLPEYYDYMARQGECSRGLVKPVYYFDDCNENVANSQFADLAEMSEDWEFLRVGAPQQYQFSRTAQANEATHVGQITVEFKPKFKLRDNSRLATANMVVENGEERVYVSAHMIFDEITGELKVNSLDDVGIVLVHDPNGQNLDKVFVPNVKELECGTSLPNEENGHKDWCRLKLDSIFPNWVKPVRMNKSIPIPNVNTTASKLVGYDLYYDSKFEKRMISNNCGPTKAIENNGFWHNCDSHGGTSMAFIYNEEGEVYGFQDFGIDGLYENSNSRAYSISNMNAPEVRVNSDGSISNL